MNSLTEHDRLKSEAVRLETFAPYPLASPVDPQQLARSGFYYVGPSDRVKCVFCNGILKSWLPNDNPDKEHRKHFPYCDFVKGLDVGNIPLQRSSMSRPTSFGSSQSLESLKFAHMKDARKRMETMSALPSSVVQDRRELVEAGFFFTGHGDSMRCFACGGALRNWERSDDPWIEHARWFPRCPYIREQKGDEFVNDIEANFRSAMAATSVPISPQRENPPRNAVHELSPMIQAVTSMGYSEDVVQRVLLDLKRIRGQGADITAESLMSAVLDDQERQNASSPAPGTSGSGAEMEDRIMCKICMEREVAVTFLPCGHLVCCEQCSRHVAECPVCRKRIRGSVRTFLA